MAVTWDALTAPAGRLDIAVLFPADYAADEGEDRLTGYIADGVAEVGDSLTGDEADAAVAKWAYYRAYLAKYELELSKAAQKSLTDQGSASKLEKQITGWKELADALLAEFEGLLPPDDVVTGAPPTTTSTPIVYVW